MSPLLIAAKLFNCEVAKKLILMEASPKARNSRGNTLLHYLSIFNFCDERLFLYDDLNTFGRFNVKSDFYIACLYCPGILDVVKTYLDQGVSPNIQIRRHDYDFGRYRDADAKDTMGRHVTGIGSNFKKECCPELVKSLLEYGADFEMENGHFIRTPLKNSIRLFHAW